MYDYDVVVIGGGSGGLVAARLARALGGKVALIDRARLGGDCLYSGCVPSKTLIHIARLAHQIRQGAARGVLSTPPDVQMSLVAATIAGVIDHVAAEEQVYVEGVEVRFGVARFQDAHTLLLNDQPLTAKSFIIATGSHPAVPDLSGLAEAGFLTNEGAFDLTALPASLAVVGGGPIGCELAQAFARLGSRVTLLQRGERLLPKEEPEVAAAVRAALEGDGVAVQTSVTVLRAGRDGDLRTLAWQRGDDAQTTRAAAILVAVGRAPNVAGLALDRAGVTFSQRGITVDQHLRTSAANIFAVGDVLGGLLFTHVAGAQAGIAAPNALLPGLLARTWHAEVVPWVTFTDPEAARVGLTEAEARARHGDAVRMVRLPWAAIDRAQTEGATDGFIKLVLGKQDAILGAHLVGAHAGEALAEVALAMRHGLGTAGILATIHAYPTLASGVQQAALEAYLTSDRLRSNRNIIRRFLPKRQGTQHE